MSGAPGQGRGQGLLPGAGHDGQLVGEHRDQQVVPGGEVPVQGADSHPGIARDPGPLGTVDPNDPAKLVVTTSHPAPYTRRVTVYVPKQYVSGTAAPFIVGADGPDNLLFTVLDNLIAEGKVPPIIAI